MENKSLCHPGLSAYNKGCDENHVNEIKTIEVDSSSYGEIADTIKDGRPIIFNVGGRPSTLDLRCNVPNVKAIALLTPQLEPLPIHETPEQKEKAKAWHLQGQELTVADIPEDTKKLIATEYFRLKRLHPNWKPSKAERKAGEKYNVKFMFES
jgi:hypothetical protein